MGDKVAYYDEHWLNQQRAYQIVCLMVGSDDEKFKDLAKETKLPEERQPRQAGERQGIERELSDGVVGAGVNTRRQSLHCKSCTISSFLRRVPSRMSRVLPQ
jgi:Putative metallopeptidase